MLKRTMGLLLTVLLVAGLLVPALAQESSSVIINMLEMPDARRYREGVYDIATDGETLYILQRDEILTYRPGDAAPEAYLHGIYNHHYAGSRALLPEDIDAAHAVYALFFRDGQLYAFDQINAQIFSITADAQGAPVYGEALKLSVSEDFLELLVDPDAEHFPIEMESLCLVDNLLIGQGYSFATYEGYAHGLVIIDLESGEAELRTDVADTYEEICPYRDGKVFIIAGDSEDFYGEVNPPWPIRIYDPQTNELSDYMRVTPDISCYSVQGLLYDEAKDTLYLVASNCVYRIVGKGEPELVAYHNAGNLYRGVNSVALVGNTIFCFDDAGLFACVPDPALLPDKVLTIANSYSNEAHKRAAARMSDVPIMFRDDVWFEDARDLSQKLVTGETQMDLISISPSWIDIDRLIDKGYCYDLSGSTVLMDWVNNIYPYARDAVMRDGKLYAIPTSLFGDMMMYNAKAFEELDLSVPTTYEEMAAFMNDFAKEENEELWEAYTLAGEDTADLNRWLMQSAMEEYELYFISQGKPLTLDTPQLRSVLSALDSIDLGDIAVDLADLWNDDGEPTQEMYEMWEKDQLFTTYGSFDVYGMDDTSTWRPLLLSIMGEDTAIIRVGGQVLFVNPRSQNIADAIRYLENRVLNLPMADAINLDATFYENIENEYYEENIRNYDQEIENLKKELETAEAVDVPMYEEMLSEWEEMRTEYVDTQRYTITLKMLDTYREYVKYARVQRVGVLWNENSGFITLWSRYIGGELPLEQLITEGNSKLRLMQLEAW